MLSLTMGETLIIGLVIVLIIILLRKWQDIGILGTGVGLD